MAAANEGDWIVYPSGNFALSSLSVSKNRVKVVGKGNINLVGLSAKTVHSLGRAAILFNGTTGGGVTGLTFNGNGIAEAAVGFKDCTGGVAERVTVSGCAGNGQITSAGGDSLTLDRCVLTSSLGASRGAWLGNLSAVEMESGVRVLDCTFSDNLASGVVVSSVGGEVRGSACSNNQGSGIVLPGANGFSARGIVCDGNTCNGNLFHGIQSDVVYSTDADLTANITATRNTCNGNDNSGVYGVNSTGWAVENNDCFDNNADSIGTGAGIQFDDRSHNATISNNRCGDTRGTGSKTQTDGVRVIGQAGSPSSVYVTANVCDGNLLNGVHVEATVGNGVNGVSVNANACSGNGAYGIKVADVDTGSIIGSVTGNTCTDSPTADIRITASSVTQSGNTFTTKEGF